MRGRNIIVQEHLETVTITNSETQSILFKFAFNDNFEFAKTDGVISIIVYPTVASGTPGTLTIKVSPVDQDGKEPQNVADHEQTLFNAVFVSQTKGTDGGYMYALTDLPKCFGLNVELTHVGTAVINTSVVLLY